MRLSVPIVVALAGVLTFVFALPASQAAQEPPRNLTVLVGWGRDTESLDAFFPRDIRVRAGDTITWRQNSDSAHTVTFLGPFDGPAQTTIFNGPEDQSVPANNQPFPGRPGVTYANPLRNWPQPGPEVNGSVYQPGVLTSSGNLAAVPQTPGVDPISAFSLVFDKPGTYQYLCFTHPNTMPGTVEVVASTATNVPSQAQITAQGEREITALRGRLDRARAQLDRPQRSDAGPGDRDLWYVSAGLSYFQLNDDRVVLDEFLPRNLTIASGDTVVWGSTGFHAVTFNPSPIAPPLNVVDTLPDGRRVVMNNPEVWDPVKPSGVFDPTQYYVSGNLNRAQPVGTAWSLTFTTPGTFEYYCAVHLDRGMKGTITVVAPGS
jgi:plastocyanin